MVIQEQSEEYRLSTALVSGAVVLEGILLKKNKWYMKQERRFKLYANGQLKYFKDSEQKGTMELTKDSSCKKISRYEIEITLPERGNKKYVLLQNDLTKCPVKSDKFSCLLDDWVD